MARARSRRVGLSRWRGESVSRKPRALSSAPTCRSLKVHGRWNSGLQAALTTLAGHARWPLGGVFSDPELPIRPDEMAGVSTRNSFKVVLMLGLSLPEIAGWSDFGHHLARP